MSMPPPELSRTVALDRIRDTAFETNFQASPEECNAVAGRLQEPAVESLRCSFTLHRPAAAKRSGEIVGEGHLIARVQRECVVSLDLFDEEIDERFRVVFVPEGKETDDDDPESVDEIPYANSAIDLGEAAVEQLALILDPYPRKPGVELPSDLAGEASGPFAALAKFTRPDEADGEG